MPERYLSAAEYSACQSLVLVLARKLEELPLDRMYNSIQRAHAAAPILDPTLYMKGANNLTQVERIVGALLTAQGQCAAPMKELREWAVAKVAQVAE